MSNARIVRTTIAEQSTIQAIQLAPQFKTEIKPGIYPIERWEYAPNGHQRVTFVNRIGNYQTWLVWGDDILCPNENTQIQLKVPYYSQRDNTSNEWWRQCNSSSHAMLLNYLLPGSVPSDDYYIANYVNPLGDTTDWSVHSSILREFGIESTYRQNLNYSDLERSLLNGFPVVIGVLHKGPINAPSGGHCLIITGMDKDRGVFFANDPWGYGFDYSNHDGQNVTYPIYPTLDRRWMVDGDDSGWGRIVRSVRGKTKL